jgi:acyl carrier protein
MGLDSVELLPSVDDHFEIEVPDRAAEKMTTVGDIHAFVVSELNRLARGLYTAFPRRLTHE